MTQTNNRLLDDLARLMTDAAGMAQGVRREVDSVFKSHLERWLKDLDLVTREEFEAVRDMAVLAREENDRLRLRLAALEARLGVGAEAGPAPGAGSEPGAGATPGAGPDAPSAPDTLGGTGGGA